MQNLKLLFERNANNLIPSVLVEEDLYFLDIAIYNCFWSKKINMFYMFILSQVKSAIQFTYEVNLHCL